ncbi:rRNA N-glycosidase [Hordeum vulgare]|nr:rRNA N-glycosidase [Hordeum vulgare]
MGGARTYTDARSHAHVIAFPSPSPPPPPRMTEEEKAWLMQRVMKDSMMKHDERQWPGLDRAMALFAAGDAAIPEQMEEEVAAFPWDLVGQQWS